MRGSGELLVFIKGTAEAPVLLHDSSSSARKRQQVGWGRALPCAWQGVQSGGTPGSGQSAGVLGAGSVCPSDEHAASVWVQLVDGEE